MSKEVGIITLGVLVGLAPFLGLPGTWRTTFLVFLGLVMVLVGIILRRDALSRGETKGTSFFVDNRTKDSQKVFEESIPSKIQ